MFNSAGRVTVTLISSLLVVPFVLLISLGASANDDKDHAGKCGHDSDSDRHSDKADHSRGHRVSDHHGSYGNDANHRHPALANESSYGSFPAVGGTYQIDLGDGRGETSVFFESDRRMSFQPLYGSADSNPVYVDYTFLPVNDDVYVIGWLDDQDQEWVATVDFASGGVCNLSARSNGDWRGYRGTFCPEDVDLSEYNAYVRGNSARVGDDWPLRGRLDWQQDPNWRADSTLKKQVSTNWRADEPGDYQFSDEDNMTSNPAPAQLEGDYVEAAGFNPVANEQCSTLLTRQLTLRSDMRNLWDEHVFLTRLYIISAIDDMPDKQAVTDRLLQNQVAIGNAFKPYYGNNAGTQLTALLTEHIVQATELVAAAKAGDTARLASAKADWMGNADSLATFLSTANPDNWPANAMRPMLYEHLNLTISGVQARLNSDWEADLSTFQRTHEQALMMADGLSDGVIAQFPDQF